MKLLVAVGALVLVLGCGGQQRGTSARGDLDGDGIADSLDKCPREPEDFDGDADGDGCPDADTSEHVFLPDLEDRCALVPGCENGLIEDDGCPDLLLIFEPGSAVLSPKTLSLLDEIAGELLQHKLIAELAISASAAPEEPNSVAEARALAVRDALIARGLGAAMLSIAGSERHNGVGVVWFTPLSCT